MIVRMVQTTTPGSLPFMVVASPAWYPQTWNLDAEKIAVQFGTHTSRAIYFDVVQKHIRQYGTQEQL